MIFLVLTLAAGCHHQLAPGETRCTSVPAGGIYVTKCRTGEALPPPAPAPNGWSCTARADGFGVCFRRPVDCEQQRYNDATFAPCAWQQVAACVGAMCFNTRESCAAYDERNDAPGDCRPEQ